MNAHVLQGDGQCLAPLEMEVADLGFNWQLGCKVLQPFYCKVAMDIDGYCMEEQYWLCDLETEQEASCS